MITNDISKTMLRMARSIRTSHYLHENQIQADSDYVKQIYIKNSAWHPPPAPWPIEEKITSFEKELKKKQKILENKYKKNKYQQSYTSPNPHLETTKG